MKKTILIAAVMFLAFSVAAFAQATFTVGSTPVTQVASCGTTELTGDISFTTVPGSLAATTGTITITYGVPIATGVLAFNVDPAINPNAVDVYLNGVAQFGALAPVAILTPATGATALVIQITNPAALPAPPFTLAVRGVRVNVAANPGLTLLDASLTSTGNLFVAGQTTVRVISAIGSAISAVDTLTGVAPNQTSTALTVNAVNPAGSFAADATFDVRVTEGFANAWVPNAMISVTFSALPAGLQLTAPGRVTSSSGTVFQRANSTGTVSGADFTFPTALAPGLTMYYKVITLGPTAPVDIETLPITFTASFIAGSAVPVATNAITATVNMAPIAGTFGLAATYVPQYTGTLCQRGPVTVITFATANTNLLIPFATTVLDYDTAIAIANTTKDTVSGTNSAVLQSGTITFMFFPQTGTPFQFTPPGASNTAGTPGSGLIAGGVLEAGRTYIVLVSELLTAANAPADFQGYIIAVCNFTNGHGEYFVSDFSSFTHGALMLVLNNTVAARTATPEGLNN